MHGPKALDSGALHGDTSPFCGPPAVTEAGKLVSNTSRDYFVWKIRFLRKESTQLLLRIPRTWLCLLPGSRHLASDCAPPAPGLAGSCRALQLPPLLPGKPCPGCGLCPPPFWPQVSGMPARLPEHPVWNGELPTPPRGLSISRRSSPGARPSAVHPALSASTPP